MLDAGLTPIVCVGENLEQNEGGRDRRGRRGAGARALQATTPEEVARLVLAYEPLWAIGTGRAATPEQANATIGAIRGTVAGLAGQDAAGAVRIQYGGQRHPRQRRRPLRPARDRRGPRGRGLAQGAGLRRHLPGPRTPGGSGARGGRRPII